MSSPAGNVRRKLFKRRSIKLLEMKKNHYN